MSDENVRRDAAWQAWCRAHMPEKTGHVYPLAGAFYECWKAAWKAAWEAATKKETHG